MNKIEKIAFTVAGIFGLIAMVLDSWDFIIVFPFWVQTQSWEVLRQMAAGKLFEFAFYIFFWTGIFVVVRKVMQGIDNS